MLDKLIKVLSGLGGTAALTTGGVFLKNHVERRMFISKVNANIKKLWGSNNEYEGLYPDGNSEDDAWKISWVFLVVGYKNDSVSIDGNFSKSFLKQREKVLWDVIMQSEGSHIRINMDKKREIDGGYTEYWEKYKEGCLFWGSFREAKDAASTDLTCMLYEKWDTYKEKSLYKSYLEIKREKDIDVMEFYWTIWRRFKSEKKSEISNKDEDKDVQEFLDIYKPWKEANKSNIFSNLDN